MASGRGIACGALTPQLCPFGPKSCRACLPRSGAGCCAGDPPSPVAGDAGGVGVARHGQLVGGLFKFGTLLGQELSWESSSLLLRLLVKIAVRVTQRCLGGGPGVSQGETEAWGNVACPVAPGGGGGGGCGGRAPEHDPPAAFPSPAIRLFPNVRRMFARGSRPARSGWRCRSCPPPPPPRMAHSSPPTPASHGLAQA